jgi:aspartyl/asparaginyl beta-hydroxylase (cupin superfamily)
VTPEIEDAFDAIKQRHGASSIARVEEMMLESKVPRQPAQAGAKWILPGISQRAWHDPYAYSRFAPLISALEANHQAIKSEFKSAWQANHTTFGNYEHYLVRQDNWKALYLFRKGGVVADSMQLVPATFRIVNEHALQTNELCPLLECHFSTLLPDAKIPPHCDLWNFSINLHFAVDIPEGCAIRVAGEERTWTEGKCLMFDYSFQHEAWNRSNRDRTCLLFDLWHPEVTLPEREALVVLITEVRNLLGEE